MYSQIHKSLESNKVSKNNQCTVLTLRWKKKKKKKERKEIKERKERKRTSLSPFTSHKNRNRPQHTYIRQVFIIPNSFQKNYLTPTSFAYCNMYFVFFIVNERCTTIIYYLNLKNCTSGLSIWNSYMAS